MWIPNLEETNLFTTNINSVDLDDRVCMTIKDTIHTFSLICRLWLGGTMYSVVLAITMENPIKDLICIMVTVIERFRRQTRVSAKNINVMAAGYAVITSTCLCPGLF